MAALQHLWCSYTQLPTGHQRTFVYNPSFVPNASYIVVSGPSAALKSYQSSTDPTTVDVESANGAQAITILSDGYDAASDSVWFRFDDVVMDGQNLYNVSISNLDFGGN